MKQKIRILLAAMLVLVGLLVTAGASSYDHCADQLNALGLFRGTTSGYALDRAPTRAEAATMLVRLLGKEAEAQKLTYTAPFTDLDGWEKPYVQYLYENGLTTGTSATTFAPASPCSAQMYTTFLLRALGYSDKGGADFAYADAISFGQSIGLVDYANCSQTNFLRDHVAAMSLTALHTPVKDSDDMLLEKLVTDGAVTQADAKELLAFFDSFDAYVKASEKMNEASKIDMTMDTKADASTGGVHIMTMTMPLRAKMDMDLEQMDQSKLEMTGTAKSVFNEALISPGSDTTQNQTVAYYYDNGVFYTKVDDQKIRQDMSFEQIAESLGISSMKKAEPICMIEDIAQSGSTITLTYSASGLTSMISTLLDSMGMGQDESVAIDIKEMTAKVTVSSGTVKNMNITMELSMEAEGQVIDMDIAMDCTINSIGSGVTVKLPTDLDTYEEMIGGADAPAA